MGGYEDAECEKFFTRKDVPLLTDVYCYECGRLVALSNAIQDDGRTYCPRCRVVGQATSGKGK